MPDHQLTLTNGAAHWAVGLLTANKGCSMADLWPSGNLMRKLRKAAEAPPNSTNQWMDESFGQIEVTQSEYEFMRALLKGLGERKELPGNFHVADLCMSFELDKP